jgi:hypothetical protein
MGEISLGQVLLVALSGATTVLVGLVLRRVADIAQDVKEIRSDVGEHSAQLAKGDAQLEQLRKDVDGLLERERVHRLPRAVAGDAG